MDFAAFMGVIASPGLRKVAAHWHEVRGARALPAWSDIRPAAIATQLPIVWSYKYDPATAAFTGRLAGEQITRIFGKDFRGASLAEVQPAAEFQWVYEMCRRIVREPALHRGEGRVYKHLDRYGSGERIILPLSGDGIVADGMIGATEYRVDANDGTTPVKPVRELEQWFSLAA